MGRKIYILFIVGFLIFAGCVWGLLSLGNSDESSLELYCAAGMRAPVEEVVAVFERQSGVKININYGGSGQLYSSLKLRGGDLYLPADSSYVEQGVNEDLLERDVYAISELKAGIVVAKGNPKGVNHLEDLLRAEVSVGLADRNAAVGKFTHQVLQNCGLLEGVQAGKFNTFPTVNEVAVQVQLGVVDAAIVWDAVSKQYDRVEWVSASEFENSPRLVSLAIVAMSEKKEMAKMFADFLRSERSAAVFIRHGYRHHRALCSPDHTE